MKPEYDFSNARKGRFFRPDARFELPDAQRADDWLDQGGKVHEFVAEESEKTLRAYRAQPNLVEEHAKQERDTANGGYAHRQLFELVQNSADALVGSGGGSILVRLCDNHLYCADDGRPISTGGIRALMFSHLSPKRNTTEIGRFGLGFKSVLGVTSRPEFFARTGSFRFDRLHAAQRIAQVAPSKDYPVLRLPECISAKGEADRDEELKELMAWANNIVRLPLDAGAHSDLAKQTDDFPAEFLLFVDHVRHLTLEAGDVERDMYAERGGEAISLDTGSGRSVWKCFRAVHTLSDDARADRRSLDDDGEVPIWWAAPLDRLNEPGRFWHFFPTQTICLLAGILNAPWKTNEDRQNLLPGAYNNELIDAAARLAAKHLPELASVADPALHLDALPRRHEAGDTDQSDRLREAMDEQLRDRPIAPDQEGHLRTLQELRYAPPLRDSDALRIWESIENRPREWVHHRALVRERMARIDRLYPSRGWRSQAPRASIREWLEALVADASPQRACEASKAALRVAAAIPVSSREGSLGRVVWTQVGQWVEPNPDAVFLPSPDDHAGMDGQKLVHRQLASDPDALCDLEALGVKPLAPETYFRAIADAVLGNDSATDADWHLFWTASRALETIQTVGIVGTRSNRVQVLTRSGCWKTLYGVLLPGDFVSTEAGEDSSVAANIDYHKDDVDLLREFGAVSEPQAVHDFSEEPGFEDYLFECRAGFTSRGLPRTPHWGRLGFRSTYTSGPLCPLEHLSDRSKARYTEALLSIEETFAKWTMRHQTQDIYPPFECESPALAALRRHGRVWCAGTSVPLADALGDHPANVAALAALLSLPLAARIREALALADPTIEPVGEEEPVPLTDAWPGLASHLHDDVAEYNLIRCLRIADDDMLSLHCLRKDTDIFLVGTGDDTQDLHLVCRELGLALDDGQVSDVLGYVTPAQVEDARARIRAGETDAARLALAVGADALRHGLPDSLVSVLEANDPTLTPIQLAEAAIATFHTSALRRYSHALSMDLAPPRRWAGSAQAVAFVKTLGFSALWAGQRNARRPPYLVVEGPLSLPPLHQYQERIVDNIRAMLLGGAGGTNRRGMISLPTGAGKTRVAVEAVVGAISRGFRGGVLWVADRDELCEQAVEAWRQVWTSVGAAGRRLRVSRMWAGQPRPLPESDWHVVVASIQTLYARLSRDPGAYAFLREFGLVVFDEAHRTVAPSFTTVMQDIGFTRRQTAEEPFLIGLTATPYRGHDEQETTRLVRRYGSHRLDLGAFKSDDPVAVVKELQGMRVIAEADHEMIDGGGFRLNDEEREQLLAMPYPAWLPRSMESRIARDASRTGRIVAAYERLIGNSGWPTLVFATSVEHAQTVAALLNAKGVTSRAVSGSTERIVRRSIVEDFRAGKIQALVNYGVFREGFDAPKTRAIIVARPVYSPNLYFQMIGRGLRGPLNGGNDRCLIINVRDNIENFERQLAFAELDWLWRDRGAG